jgi:hypothetical protein
MITLINTPDGGISGLELGRASAAEAEVGIEMGPAL